MSVATSLVFLSGGEPLTRTVMGVPWISLTFVWLFGLILVASVAVVRHAEHLAHRLGEPFGTLILTLSVTAIEVASISAVMLHGEGNPTLVRETLFAVIMIILNGMVGMSLLLGGWIHKEQDYNLQGANAYLSVIVPLAVLSLIMPDFTRTTPGPTLSFDQQMFLVVIASGLYCAFLALQTGRHHQLFDQTPTREPAPQLKSVSDDRSATISGLLLLGYLVPIIYMADLLAQPISYVIENLKAPTALGGVIIAVLVATPEGLGAVRAAMANQLQRSMNIFLGSVLSTIGLTIPAMLIIGNLTGRHFVLGLEHTDIVMLLLTLFSSGITFASGRTNVLQGGVHIVLFAAYVLLIFQD
ncbi:MAG TPA: calcium:proton antiporter [Steroidobacteraceae bacterium]